MAKCDEGYVCELCGENVDHITESELYLRYVVGLIDPETLHTTRERHIQCNPTLAQFIVDAAFPQTQVEGEFCKERMDSDFVAEQEKLITRGWRRLREIETQADADLPILEYPLPEIQQRLREDA